MPKVSFSLLCSYWKERSVFAIAGEQTARTHLALCMPSYLEESRVEKRYDRPAGGGADATLSSTALACHMMHGGKYACNTCFLWSDCSLLMMPTHHRAVEAKRSQRYGLRKCVQGI